MRALVTSEGARLLRVPALSLCGGPRRIYKRHQCDWVHEVLSDMKGKAPALVLVVATVLVCGASADWAPGGDSMPDPADLDAKSSLPSWPDIVNAMEAAAKQMVCRHNQCCEEFVKFIAKPKEYPNFGSMMAASARGLPPDWGDFSACQRIDSAHHCSLGVRGDAVTRSLTMLGLCVPQVCHGPEDLEPLVSRALDKLKVKIPVAVICDDDVGAEGANIPKWDWVSTTVCVLMGAAFLLQVVAGLFVAAWPQLGSWVAQGRQPAAVADERSGEGLAEALLEKGESSEQAPAQPPVASLRDRSDLASRLLLALAPQESFADLMKASRGALEPMHGLRVLAMCWVLLGHSFYFILPYIRNAGSLKPEALDKWWFQPVLAGTLSVDMFFYLGGFVSVFALHRRYSRGKGWQAFTGLLHVHRALRIFPMYSTILLFWWKVYPFMISGPRFHETVGAQTVACDRSWWTNFLFINNIYSDGWMPDQGDMCLGWSWYLAVDYQLFILTPFVVYVFYRSRALGWVVLSALMAGSLGSIAYVVIKNEMEVSSPNYWSKMYVNPFTRASTYLIGLGSGFVFTQLGSKHRRIPTAISMALHAVAFVVMALVVFIQYGDVTKDNTSAHNYPKWERILYNGASRPLFTAGLAVTATLLFTGNSIVLGRVLSWRPFHVVQKLTFGMYLIHPLVLFGQYGAYQQPAMFSQWFVLGQFSMALTMTGTLAALAFVFVERPAGQVVDILLRTK